MVVDGRGTEEYEVDRLFHALADATRRDLLRRAGQEELSVSALGRAYAISLPAVQKHVRVLEGAGLVARTRIGRETRVRAVPEQLMRARALLDQLEEHWRHRVAAMDDLLAEPPADDSDSDRPNPRTP